MNIFIRRHPEGGYPYIEDVDPRPPDGLDLNFEEGWYTRIATEAPQRPVAAQKWGWRHPDTGKLDWRYYIAFACIGLAALLYGLVGFSILARLWG